MNDELEYIWSQVRSGLAEAVDEAVFRIWLEPLRPLDLDGGQLTLQAPAQTCEWIRERFGRSLQTAVAAVVGPDATVDVISREPFGPGGQGGDPGAARVFARNPGAHVGPDGRRRNRRELQRQLDDTKASFGAAETSPAQTQSTATNAKLTFDQFVIGDSNRLAHAAALTVAEMPSQAYNPLFLCGPPGVGKTHLLRSIEAYLARHAPGLRTRTTTGESFTNAFLQALASSGLEAFKRGFRHVDVLLIDDVQFLERKSRTEEEFFHTFNALYEAGSQIVLSSDRPPQDLQALEDRLRERFQSGLVADIRPPDFSTRLAILRKRAQHDGIERMDPLALEAIAERISANVRSLEGALIRIVAYSSLTGKQIDAELATRVLDGLYPQRSPQVPTIEQIKGATCRQFGIDVDELTSRARAARVAHPRQLAIYLSRELTDASLPAIGREFGGRDHSTVLNSLKRAQRRIEADPGYRSTAEQLRKLISDTADRPT